ncbi:MAG TPA: hypothetical protein VGM82_17255 [Gemmatimonadaceae bacterium]|jgi:hypothetical protein
MRLLRLAASLLLATALPLSAQQRPDTAPTFAALVSRLSESGGYFDSDNIITNEASYLHIASQLSKVGVRGGIYMGVGPDQNFSYIALIRPTIALMVDIRRDNLLEHLLFKSMFMMSRNRLEYLCHLLGKPIPTDIDRWTGKPIAEVLAYINKTPTDSNAVRATRAASTARINGFNVSLDARDRSTIDAYRAEFVASGLETRYSSLGRNNRSDYPSFGQLIRATDRAGKEISYLADEDAFQFIRSMEQRDRIIPVVCNVAGNVAMRSIARYATENNLVVSAFYLSNVEQYLIQRDQGFDRYVANVRALPHTASSVIIRSYFGRFGQTHPLYVPAPGNVSTSMVEPMDSFLRRAAAREIGGYADLVFNGFVPPQ